MGCRLRIGLTGGIGSGKSAASDYFRRLGIPVIDTDELARELVEPGQPALQEIVQAFGDGMLDADGRLDRAALRKTVFSDAGKRKQLERILHPRIRETTGELAAAIDAPYCILVIPLLLETDYPYDLDRVLVIDVPADLQVQRVMERNGMSRAEIEAIIDSQVTRKERLEVADDVVVNDGDLDRLYGQLEHLHRTYLDLARNK